MSTDDFIYKREIDEPRHEQNMPIGIVTPVPKRWKADRPGDTKRSTRVVEGKLLGHAGPNIGFALTLSKTSNQNWFLIEGEHIHDVEVLLAEIAMRRSSHFGRAPIQKDINLAAQLFGYDKQPIQGKGHWRLGIVHGCSHDEHKRRIIINSVPQEIISSNADIDQEMIRSWRGEVEELF